MEKLTSGGEFEPSVVGPMEEVLTAKPVAQGSTAAKIIWPSSSTMAADTPMMKHEKKENVDAPMIAPIAAKGTINFSVL